MKDTNKQHGEVRSIYVPGDVAETLDRLAESGAVVSRVITTALRQSLPKIEKDFEAGKMKELRPRRTVIRNY
jgi:hypothetical protein